MADPLITDEAAVAAARFLAASSLGLDPTEIGEPGGAWVAVARQMLTAAASHLGTPGPSSVAPQTISDEQMEHILAAATDLIWEWADRIERPSVAAETMTRAILRAAAVSVEAGQ